MTAATEDRDDPATSLTSALRGHIAREVRAAGGWLPFDAFMALALYAPGLGYYANDTRKFGALPASGSDFVTAPEMTPLFGRALAAQVAQVLQATGAREVCEFGAGSGALARQLIEALDAAGVPLARYNIVDLSGTLRERQRAALAAFGGRMQWLDTLPDAMHGVIVGNEVLDAMPVKLLLRRGGTWHERGVVVAEGGGFAWSERATDLRPPVEIDGPHDYLTEIHPQAQAFVRTLAERLSKGAAIFLDYGFGEREYYHPQRHMGTVMTHRGHRADADPLADVGLKDITAHVDFTAIALAAQDSGLDVAGYTSQARFLINCGLVGMLEGASIQERVQAQRLLHEHEMGELFKAIAFTKGVPAAVSGALLGFAEGDRTHTL